MWPTRHSWSREAFIDIRARSLNRKQSKTFISVTYDSSRNGMIGGNFHAERSVYTDVSTRREEPPSPPAPDERPPPSFATPPFLDEKTAAADFRAAVDAWRAPVPSSTAAAVRAPRARGRARAARRAGSQPPPHGDVVNGDAVGGAPTGDGTARAASSTSKNGGALGGSTDGADDAYDAILNSVWIVA